MSRSSTRLSTSPDSASTRNKDKKETEKERRDKLNKCIQENYEKAKEVNCKLFLGVSPPDGKPTKNCMLEFANKVLGQILTQQLNAKAGQVVVPAAHHQQPSSCQIDHRYLRLGCYQTIHSSTGHIIECTAEIQFVNGYLPNEVMWNSPYDAGYIHREDLSYTYTEQIKMFTLKTGSVCYRIIRGETNSKGEEKEIVTYQRSYGELIDANRFRLVNYKIEKREFESYQASIQNVPITPVYSGNSSADYVQHMDGAAYPQGQPASNHVSSSMVGPAGPATYAVHSGNSGVDYRPDELTSITSPVNSEDSGLEYSSDELLTPNSSVNSDDNGADVDMDGSDLLERIVASIPYNIDMPCNTSY